MRRLQTVAVRGVRWELTYDQWSRSACCCFNQVWWFCEIDHYYDPMSEQDEWVVEIGHNVDGPAGYRAVRLESLATKLEASFVWRAWIRALPEIAMEALL